jgi:thiamine kinase-like enzyme
MTLNLNQFAYSNDNVEVIHHNNSPYVLKTFYTQLDRASRSVKKQDRFRPMSADSVQVKAAEVLKFDVFAERAELLMPFVNGITGHMLPVHATRNIGHMLSTSLSALIYSELEDSREEIIETLLFREKLASVSDATHDPDMKRLINTCLDVVDTFPNELRFPMGNCHGDLTLSNVIIDPNSGITLIDFQDTFLETPLQDIAKLKQDFIYGWTYRDISPPLSINAEIFCRHHFPKAIVQIEGIYPKQLQLLTIMALARIAPYVKDIKTNAWLFKKINDCIRITHK